MRVRTVSIALLASMAWALGSTGCRAGAPARGTVRLGYFPNVTHSQAVLGVADGTFRRALGEATVDATVFNAGPSVIEAIFAGQLDAAYIGPSPAINGYVRSKGQALRVVAGATSGGAVLVVRGDSGISRPADFAGRRVASPQLGNTQDVALRAWLETQGLTPSERGGQTRVLPVANPDILALFLTKEIDAAWVPEPWGARLVHEAHGRVFLDERELWPEGRFVTAHVIVSKRFLDERPSLVRKLLEAHVALTRRINADPATARRQLNAEIERLTGKRLPPAVLEDAWGRMSVTWDPIASSLVATADAAFRLGFLGDARPNLDGIYDLRLLNEVLRAQGLPEVRP